MKQVKSSCESKAHFQQLDRDFVALVDGAFQDAAQRSGPHLLCSPGCSQCCVGVFAIGAADVLRIRQGLADMDREDPDRAARVRARAAASWTRLSSNSISGFFPGDPASGILDTDGEDGLSETFHGFGDHEVCPALDPETATCDLYHFRPYTCRVFGPPVVIPEGFGVCELCFQNAHPEEVAAAAMSPEPEGVSDALEQAAVDAGSYSGNTILAFVLSRPASL